MQEWQRDARDHHFERPVREWKALSPGAYKTDVRDNSFPKASASAFMSTPQANVSGFNPQEISVFPTPHPRSRMLPKLSGKTGMTRRGSPGVRAISSSPRWYSISFIKQLLV